jgi:hypothetical protein
MRAIMQGLTDAEFERLYGTEDRAALNVGFGDYPIGGLATDLGRNRNGR